MNVFVKEKLMEARGKKGRERGRERGRELQPMPGETQTNTQKFDYQGF
jgi:hypothetical protein